MDAKVVQLLSTAAVSLRDAVRCSDPLGSERKVIGNVCHLAKLLIEYEVYGKWPDNKWPEIVRAEIEG